MAVGTIGTGLCMAGLYGTAMGNSSGIFEKYPLCMGVLVVLPGVFSLVVLAGIGRGLPIARTSAQVWLRCTRCWC